MQIDPREFTDFSDYPQDGFGNLDADKEYPEPKEEDDDCGDEEDIDDDGEDL